MEQLLTFPISLVLPFYSSHLKSRKLLDQLCPKTRSLVNQYP